jgi:hypothetical protein
MNDFAKRGARASDPYTSHLAARRTPILRSRDRMLVLYEHAKYSKTGLTDFELAANLNRQQTSVGKRRGELRDLGLIHATSLRRLAPSGSAAIVWALTFKGRVFLASQIGLTRV